MKQLKRKIPTMSMNDNKGSFSLRSLDILHSDVMFCINIIFEVGITE